MIEALLYYGGVVVVAVLVLVTYLAVTIGIFVLVLTTIEYLLLTVEVLAATVMALVYLNVMLDISPVSQNRPPSVWLRVRNNFSTRMSREHRLCQCPRSRRLVAQCMLAHGHTGRDYGLCLH